MFKGTKTDKKKRQDLNPALVLDFSLLHTILSREVSGKKPKTKPQQTNKQKIS